MDELSALPPEDWKRTSSVNPRYSFSNSSPSTVRTESLPQRSTNLNLKVNTTIEQTDVPFILSPTPRRHLLESSVSQHWLNSPVLSATSSRPSSPLPTTTGNKQPALSLIRRRFGAHHQSFSPLLEQQHQGTIVDAGRSSGKEHESEGTAMGRRWIRWMHKRGISAWVIPGVIVASTLVKFAIGLGSYSGESTPPMFGDYEAQRHWMELTIHLPLHQWYTYDLPYWGLDYPPLTAYASWICGIIGDRINPSWVALDTSRGIESPESKLFMRTTVVVLDALVYVPALFMFSRTWQASRSKRTQESAFLTLILQPALLLIDFGHFQYNSVMLGFTLLALNFFANGHDLMGAFFFVLSLGFKQMALYYAPAIGSYLLAKCLYLGPIEGGRLFIRLTLVTVSTFLLLFLPFLPPFASVTAILDPISRIFPFARGLFEDKVANFWCASNVVFKWKAWASRGFLVKVSTLFTALGFLPAVVGLLRAGIQHSQTFDQQAVVTKKEHTPFLPLLPYALFTSSMSFFLFSFQVHEKTILLPLLPITLLLSAASVDSAVYSWGALVNNVAVFSMWPLLKRDGLGVQYIAALLLWNRLIGYNPVRSRPRSFIQFLSVAVYAAILGLHGLEMVITPPSRYPDLFVVLNVLISASVFALAWLWSIKCGVEVSWASSGLGSTSHMPPKTKASSEDADATRYENVIRRGGGRVVSLGYAQPKEKSEER